MVQTLLGVGLVPDLLPVRLDERVHHQGIHRESARQSAPVGGTQFGIEKPVAMTERNQSAKNIKAATASNQWSRLYEPQYSR
jgi:hypothetical protein